MTPKYWFRKRNEDGSLRTPSLPFPSKSSPRATGGRKTVKKLILSQTMVIDIDTNKVDILVHCLKTKFLTLYYYRKVTRLNL